MDELTRLGINFVPKDKNSPNVPQLRSIEDFWANLKRKVYANNYTPKNLKCLKNKIKLELEKMQYSVFLGPRNMFLLNVEKLQEVA